MKTMTYGLLLGAVVLAVSRASSGQEEAVGEEARAVELGETVVTATRVETPQKDAPAKVTVITEEQIRATGAQSVDEALRDASEVGTVGDSVYQGVKPQAGLRGVPDQSRTLVLVDGVPLNAAWLGRIEWWMLPVESVERIELAHGPMSAMYGSSAMGGVINVTTKTPTEPSETFVTGGYGSLDSWSTTFSQGGRYGNFAYYLAGRFFQSDGYVPEKNPRSYDVPRDREGWSTLLKLVWEPDEASSLTFGYIHGDEEACRGREYFNRDDRADLAYLKYSRSTTEARFKGTLFVNDQLWKRDFDQGPSLSTIRH